MSWEVTVKLAEGSEQVGSISAVWTDPDPNLGVFTYGRKARATVSLTNAFIDEVITARDAWQVSQANNNTRSAWTLGELNTADPKVE